MIRETAPGLAVIAGRYRLIRVIGEGGMSRVWLARDEMLGRDVAAKEMVGSFDTWTRTIREAQAAARLAHPNVVRVYDVVIAGQRPWIMMEYVPSRSLDAIVAAGGPLSPTEAATIGIAVLDGLVAAHRAGVLHRDVKPQNVLVADDGRVMLGDFGVAAFDDAGEITHERAPLASPLFVAPERVRDGTSTVHTDLWSFGATLYWLVEGRPPFARATLAEQLSAVQREEPDPMQQAGALAGVIDGLLVREPAQRLTATIVRRMLCEITDPSPHLPRSGGLRGRFGGTFGEGAARRRAAALALAGALVVSAVAAVVALRDQPSMAAQFVPAPSASPTAAGPASSLDCDLPGATGVVVAGAPGRTLLPDGWVWQDEAGFRIGVPGGWRRTAADPQVCYRDPAGRRRLTVQTGASIDPDRVGAWLAAERQTRALLDGYQRVAITAVDVRAGGADWEYTYRANGETWHVLRRSFAVDALRAYVLTWTTPDADWTGAQPDFLAAATSFDPVTS